MYLFINLLIIIVVVFRTFMSFELCGTIFFTIKLILIPTFFITAMQKSPLNIIFKLIN